MKKVLIGLAIVAVLLLAAVVAAPLLIPKDWIVAYVLEQVKAKTGREATVSGPVDLTVVPRLQIEAADVAFANVPGGKAPQMARAKSLQLELQTMPLLSGRVAVDSFVLTDPVIALEVDREGRPNWRFGQAAAPAGGGPATDPAAGPAAPPASGGGRIEDIQLGDVRLVNGTLSYTDLRSGATHAASAVDATITLPSLDAPASFKGNFTWNGKKLDVSLDVAPARALMTGEATDLGVKLAGDVVTFDFNGKATLGDRPELSGRIDLDVPSLRNLGTWIGTPITFDRPNTFGAFKIAGKAAASRSRASVTEAVVSLDALRGRGEMSADFAAAKPTVQGRLDLERLDVNPYLLLDPAGRNTAGAGAPAPAAPPAARTAGWSTEPIDLAPLRTVNVDLALSAGSLQYRRISVGKAALRLQVQDGRLTADLSELALYGGTASGKLTLDSAGAPPGVALALKLASLQADPFLRDAMGFDRIAGRLNGEIDVTTRGASQRAMIEGLGGRGALRVNDGIIKGVNLIAMVRNVSSAFLDGGAGGAERTDFSSLGGTFTIARGVLTNNDLAMRANLVQLKGAGTIDLPRQTLRYRVEPEITQLEGITVPVVIEGPWSGLGYRPDLQALLRDPGRTIDAIRNLGNQQGGGLPDLLGGSRPGESGGGLPTQLKGLFGR